MAQKKSPANQKLGNAIRSARLRLGISKEAFTRREEVYLDRSYFGAVERGELNVSLDTSTEVARGLKLTAAELMRQAGL
jgi:transcriptional regulator with XRE-family HTH domain